MPFLVALAPALFPAAIGGTLTGTAAGTPMLGISGRVCIFGEPSTHLMLEVAPGKWENVGGCRYIKTGATEEFLSKFPGIPILAPNLKTEVGVVTRAWVEGDDFMIEGTIRDSEAARWTLTGKAGLCLQLRNTKKVSGPEDQFTGEYECLPTNLRICLPRQSGFESSYVKFTDSTIKLEDAEKPRSTLPWMEGHNW